MPLKTQGMDQVFSFCEINFNNIYKEIKKLKSRKTAESTGIPVKIIRENTDISQQTFVIFFNENIRSGKFPSLLKKC